MQLKTFTLTLAFFAILQNAAIAQKLTVESMTAAPMDLSASQYERKDLAGKSCGLVKVQLALERAVFEGCVTSENRIGEYWVYMEDGAYRLTVKHAKFVPLHINFRDYGIERIDGKRTYILSLLLPESKEKAKQQFTIRYTPKDAIVIIDSNPYPGSDGVVTASLPVGQHDYLVTASGYSPIDGSIRLKTDAPSTIRIDLEKTKVNTVNIPVQHPVQQSITSHVSPVEDNIETFTVNGVSFNMVRIEGGSFTMGATSEQGSDAYVWEKPEHQVSLSAYSIGETEVTQALWQAVMDNNPSYYKGSNRPVEKVSWNDCQIFVQKLNQLTGRRFRLPTEAEWEYAARGGSKSSSFKYSGSNNIDDVAWYSNNSSSTQNVKTKKSNELGLYDMSGNVWEWCQDWWKPYDNVSQSNPNGPSSGSSRVIRGGSWYNFNRYCRVSQRSDNRPTTSSSNLGLRLAL